MGGGHIGDSLVFSDPLLLSENKVLALRRYPDE
jgi:hypothetical protein